jgi:hypothetical protein
LGSFACAWLAIKNVVFFFAAIYLPTANELKTNDLVVHNNMVYRDIEIYGGGALYIGVNYFGSAIDIGGNFTNNKVMFVYKNDTFAGSEHGEGGAIKFDWVEGTPLIRGYFANNYAPDGAAIQVMVCVRFGRGGEMSATRGCWHCTIMILDRFNVK